MKRDILVVEDSPTQAQRLRALLEANGWSVRTACNGHEGLVTARETPPTLVISDVIMPQMDGYQLCRSIKDDQALTDVPVILVTTLSNAEDVIKGFEAGANSLLAKPYSEELLLSRVERVTAGATVVGPDGALEVPIGGERHVIRAEPGKILDFLLATYENAVYQYRELERVERELKKHEDRLEDLVEERTAQLHAANEDLQRQVAERQRAEQQIADLAKFPAENPNPVLRIAHDGTVTYANESSGPLLECWGCVQGDLLPAEFRQIALDAMESRTRREMEVTCSGTAYSLTFTPIPGTDYLDLYGYDVTERKSLEEQLRQSQKMEAIGRLAGGIAHDFNNILTGIIGYAQFLLDEAEEDSQASRDLRQIRDLGDRAARLTGQLLAFSRRQPLEPVVLNINSLVGDIARMLRRLIGENIELKFGPSDDLGNVRADPGQVEQVLMNLAVNARDAMPDGGRLTIETANVELDQEYANSHPDAEPGPHVMLAVSDTGCGIDKDTRERIFEPFFTTKKNGKGTGLGLATVYGIVKQHNGNIYVYSEPGRGTTFKVYLPRVGAAVGPPKSDSSIVERAAGGETVLLVEDEDAVRDLAVRVLKRAGYTVLAAGRPSEAVRIFAEHAGEVDLLLTDVVLPERSGRELHEELTRSAPSLKALYTSGYSDGAVVNGDLLKEGTAFLQKPFTPSALAWKVREVLGGD